MYAQDAPLWRRYEQACDFLEDDLESGFVRVLQEMIAAGWSAPDIAEAARDLSPAGSSCSPMSPRRLPTSFGGLGPFSPAEVATLIGNVFMGSEAMLLLGFDRHGFRSASSLRRIGEVIRIAEQRAARDRRPRRMPA